MTNVWCVRLVFTSVKCMQGRSNSKLGSQVGADLGHSKNTLPKWTWTAPYFSMKIPYLCLSGVMVIPSGIITTQMTWYHHDLVGQKDRIFTEKHRAVQIRFGKVVLLWDFSAFSKFYYMIQIFHNIRHCLLLGSCNGMVFL